MTYEETIKVIPNEVRDALDYFNKFFSNYSGNNVLNFSSIKNKNEGLCCLYTSLKKDSYHEFKIPAQYDYLFYSQLLISLLDNYLNGYKMDFTSMYKIDDSFSYRFYLFKGKTYITVILDSNSDLDKLVDYYNDRILSKHEFNILNQRGVRI